MPSQPPTAVPDRVGDGPAGPGGVSPSGGVRMPGRDRVATWLPEGRWATEEPPAPADAPRTARADPAHRRGLQRVRVARLGARLSGWPRRALAAALLLAAVVVALRPGGPSPATVPSTPAQDVVVAARELAAGTVLSAADLRITPVPVTVVPGGAVARPAAVVGRVAAGPIRQGEAVTDTRVVGPGLTAGLGPGGYVAVPVRLAEPEAAAIARAGDRVDVLGAAVGTDGTPPTRDATEVATGVRVLAVLGDRGEADGVVLVVAATPPVARRLAGAVARQRLTVAVRPPP